MNKVMRHKRTLGAIPAALVLAAAMNVGAAHADGMPSRGAPPIVQQAPTSWSGFYFGVHSGWEWSDFSTGYPAFGTAFDVSHDAAVVGGHIGIQHQWGALVLGVEGNLTVAYQDGFSTTDCPNTNFTCAARFDDVLTIGPRIGWAMGKWMPYITGGYANARFTEREVLKANNNLTLQDSQRHGGWFIGGGVEMAIASGWTMGIDYRHYEYDSTTYTPHCAGINDGCTAVGVVLFPNDRNSADTNSDIVTLRVSWKFDRPPPMPAPMK